MGKGVVVALLILAGFLCYLAYRGVTVKDAVGWVQRQFGIKSAGQELKGVPYHNYAPVVQ